VRKKRPITSDPRQNKLGLCIDFLHLEKNEKAKEPMGGAFQKVKIMGQILHIIDKLHHLGYTYKVAILKCLSAVKTGLLRMIHIGRQQKPITRR